MWRSNTPHNELQGCANPSERRGVTQFLGDCVVLLDVPNVVKHDFLFELIALRPDGVVCAYCVKVRRALFVGP